MANAKVRPRFQDVIDKDDIAAVDAEIEITQDFDFAGRHLALAVARQGQKIDLGRHPGVMHCTDQIGRKNEAALQHGHDEQLLDLAGMDFSCQFADAGGDLIGGEYDVKPFAWRFVVHTVDPFRWKTNGPVKRLVANRHPGCL